MTAPMANPPNIMPMLNNADFITSLFNKDGWTAGQVTAFQGFLSTDQTTNVETR